MRNPSKSAVSVAATGALALLLATSAFAEERHHDETRQEHRQQREARSGNRDGATQESHENARRSEPGREQNRTWNQGQAQAQAPAQTFEQRNTNRTYEQRNNNRTYDQRNNNRTFEQGNTNRTFEQRNNTTNRSYEQRNNNRSYDQRNNNRGYEGNRDYRGNNNRGSHESYRNGIPRSDGRVTMLGRISNYRHERGGYRIWVGGSLYPYWVPELYFRSHRLAIGLDLRLGGIFRDGAVYVDALGYPGDPYYNDPYYTEGVYAGGYDNYDNGYLRGTVDNVDYRTGTLYLRDDSSGRVIAVDMRRVDRRYSRLDTGDLRRGDRVSLNGSWVRAGLFAADRIDSVDAY